MRYFQTIVIDPPWNETGGGKIRRGADRHYPLMKTPAIIDTVRNCRLWYPADNAHLYLWVTNNFLRDGLQVMKALDFRYVTMLTWAKDRFGLGYYFRGQTEQVLFGVRGKLPPLAKTQSTLINAARQKHSQKPNEFFEKIEQVSPAPRLELFARVPRDGWVSWGDEIK